jgi:hypothetical protein
MSTREAIRRDKTVGRLGLQRLAALPHESCVHLLQDACAGAAVTDPWLVGDTVRKMAVAVSAVPALEQVCFVLHARLTAV